MGERPTLWVNCSYRWWDDEAPCKYMPNRVWHRRKQKVQAGEKHVNTRGGARLIKQTQNNAKGGKYSYQQTSIYAGPLEFTKQSEDTCLINGVCVIKRPPPPPPPSPVFLPYVHTDAHTCKFATTQNILFVMRTNIMYYGRNCFCALLCARARAPIKSESGCFILPLNVFPIDHCSKDVINNLKAWLTSTFL